MEITCWICSENAGIKECICHSGAGYCDMVCREKGAVRITEKGMFLTDQEILNLKETPVAVEYVHVGGDCYGTPLNHAGKCPKCGLTPDMQSIKLRKKLAEVVA